MHVKTEISDAEKKERRDCRDISKSHNENDIYIPQIELGDSIR